MSAIVRRATLHDTEQLGHVHVDCWNETYTGVIPQDYLDLLDPHERGEMWGDIINKGGVIFVAEVDGKIIGFANCGENRSPELKVPGEMYALYLLNSYQSKGIGKKLFETVRENLVSRNLAPFTAWVLEKNPTTNFYEKNGGKILADKLEETGGVVLKEFAYIWEK